MNTKNTPTNVNADLKPAGTNRTCKWRALASVRRLLALALLTIIGLSASAATINEAWMQRYSGAVSNSADFPVKAVRDAAGDIIVTGRTEDISGTRTDILTFKYSGVDGRVLWQRRFDAPPNAYTTPSDLAVGVNGDVAVTGWIVDGTDIDYYTAKYSSVDGTLLWERTFDSPAHKEDQARAVAVDRSGNVVVTGQSVKEFAVSEFYTVKYAAANGAVIWERRHQGSPEGYNGGTAVAVDAEDNVIVIGSSDRLGSVTRNFYTAKYGAADGALLWEQYYDRGTVSDGNPVAVKVDALGDVLVTGSLGHETGATDFHTIKYAGVNGSLRWERRYNGPANRDDTVADLALDKSGNVVVTGTSQGGSLEPGDFDVYTAKYASADGALLWEHRLGGPDRGPLQPAALAIDTVGNVIVTGSAQATNIWTIDFFTAKYGAENGELLWERRYNGSVDLNDDARSITVEDNGDVVVTGYSVAGGGSPENTDYYTAKYASENGAVLWEQRYTGFRNNSDRVTAVTMDKNGNVIVTGASWGNGANYDYATVKYEAGSGAQVWEQRYNGPANLDDTPVAVAVDGNNNVVVTGDQLFRNEPAFGNIRHGFYTAKYAAASGALLWERRYSGLTNRYDRALALAVDAIGNVVVTGFTGTNDASNDFHTAKYAAMDGTLLWEKFYNGPQNGEDRPAAVTVDASGNVVVTGRSRSTNGLDIYTAKYASSDGALLWEQRYSTPGSDDDKPYGIAADAAGNVLVVGHNRFGGYTVKYAARDGAVLWERIRDGYNNAQLSALAVDAEGNVAVRGADGIGDYFAKYAAADGALLWEKISPQLFGFSDGLAVDAAGNVVAASSGHTAKYAARDGALLWEKRIPGHPLAVAANGATILAYSSGDDYVTAKYIENTNTPAVLINEVLIRSESGFVELFNPAPIAASIGGWFISDDFNVPWKFRVPSGTTMGPMAFAILANAGFNSPPGSTNSFSLNPLGGRLHLFSADEAGNLTGYRHGVAYDAAAVNESFGRHAASTGEESFPGQSVATPGAPNSGPRVGPVVISEIHPRPLLTEDVFIELKNISPTSVSLYSSTNRWRLKVDIGVTYAGIPFPADIELGANQSLLLVASDSSLFRARHGVPAAIPILELPLDVRLIQDYSPTLRLQRPELSPSNDVIYVTVDAARSAVSSPWLAPANGYGPSLQRINPTAYGNDLGNWVAARPTPGLNIPNGLGPAILAQPQNIDAAQGQSASFNLIASGAGPLSYQWSFNGARVPDGTNSSLALSNIQPSQAGRYHVAVFNPQGSRISAIANLTVAAVVTQPTNQFARPGSNVLFSVVAVGAGGLSYQWSKNGVAIPGATYPSLSITNAQLADRGTYGCVITDLVRSFSSISVELFILIPPIIVQHPLSQSVVTGATVALSVSVTNTATLPITYRLVRNGSALPFSMAQVLTQHTAYFVLSGTNVAPPWNTYGFRTSNFEGQTQSEMAAFTYLLDTDGDNIPDAWEAAYRFGTNNAADATLDSDGDGSSNRAEYFAGTNPTNALSYLKVESITAGVGAAIRFQAVSNHSYTVQFRDALGTGLWEKLSDVVARGTNRLETVLDPASTTNRFYRLSSPVVTSP